MQEKLYRLAVFCSGESFSDTREVLSGLVPFSRIAEETAEGKSTFLVFFDEETRALEMLESVRAKGLSAQIKELYRTDWTDPWKEHVRPFHLAGDFRIVPAWRAEEKDAADILIDTDVTFGLGDHPTTSMLAGMIARCLSGGESFLDAGSGTGVLSVLANKCGAKNVTAVDICEEAVRIADKNLKLNGISSAKVLMSDVRDLPGGAEYDFIAANLDTATLIAFGAKLGSFLKQKGYLAVSGVSAEKADIFSEKFPRSGLDLLSTEKRCGWFAFLFRNKGAEGEQKRGKHRKD